MLIVRRAEDRGHTDLGWLNSYHTFSFGSYNDPAHMGFRALRVLNDDRVAPGRGFGAHGHRDMEILSYVLEGTLGHKDSMSDEHTLVRDEVQTMSAGSGIIHSEFNPSAAEPVHFLQIWIEPSRLDVPPSYQHHRFARADRRRTLHLLAGPSDHIGTAAAHIHQDARIYAALVGNGESVAHPIAAGRHAWVHCAVGAIVVNGVALNAGDGVAVSDEAGLTMQGASASESELLVFDLA